MATNTKSITITMLNGEFSEFTRIAGQGNMTPQELALQLVRQYLVAVADERKGREMAEHTRY